MGRRGTGEIPTSGPETIETLSSPRLPSRLRGGI